MLKLKLFVAGMVLAILVPLVAVVSVGQAQEKKEPAKKIELPKEIKIPEARTDKVLLFQEQRKSMILERKLLIETFKTGEEWKAIDAKERLVFEKLAAEMTSTLRAAGVEDKDFPKYTLSEDGKTIRLNVPEDATPKK